MLCLDPGQCFRRQLRMPLFTLQAGLAQEQRSTIAAGCSDKLYCSHTPAATHLHSLFCTAKLVTGLAAFLAAATVSLDL